MQLDIIQNIKELAAPLAEARSLFVVDVEVNLNSTPEVWVYLDAEERGVNLDECADISRELGFLMDAHELFEGKYLLNVSSPGLSRPLLDRRQYKKNEGRSAKIKFKQGDKYEKINGSIAAVTPGGITVENENEGAVHISFDDIMETKIVPKI